MQENNTHVWKYCDQKSLFFPMKGPQLSRESFKDKWRNSIDVHLAPEKQMSCNL